MPQIALFPIPDCIAFPGTVFPLHVFEPRYRAMVSQCLEDNMMIGICHTQKLVKPAAEDQTNEERMASNQATYKPCEVFSAGHCELVDTLEDGRLLINVHVDQRYRLVNEVQTLPFTIAECEALPDEPLPENERADAELEKEKITQRLLAITHKIEEAQNLLNSEVWQQKTPEEFSFQLLSIFRFASEDLQRLLEMTNVTDRLNEILRILNEM